MRVESGAALGQHALQEKLQPAPTNPSSPPPHIVGRLQGEGFQRRSIAGPQKVQGVAMGPSKDQQV